VEPYETVAWLAHAAVGQLPSRRGGGNARRRPSGDSDIGYVPGVRILAVCGSLQARSANLSLLHVAAASAPAGVEVILFDGLRHLPHFDPDIESSGEPPGVREWRKALAETDAVLIASPEYGHSLPGALKNGIDWVIGSGELERKVVAITAAVPHPERGRLGLQALKQTLGAVSATVVGGEPIARGPEFEREVAELLRGLVRAARGNRPD
jgi:chromate reductase